MDSSQVSPLLVVNIEISETEVESIPVYPKDTPIALAKSFCQQRNLPAEVESILATTIQQKLIAAQPKPVTRRLSSSFVPSLLSLDSYQARWKTFFTSLEKPPKKSSENPRRSSQQERCTFKPDTQRTKKINEKLLQQAAVKQSNIKGLQPNLKPLSASPSSHQQRSKKLAKAMVTKKLKFYFEKVAQEGVVTQDSLETPGIPKTFRDVVFKGLQEIDPMNFPEFCELWKKELEGTDLTRRYELLHLEWEPVKLHTTRNTEPTKVFNQQMEWLTRRDQQLAEARENEVKKQLSGCTFYPNRRRN